MNHSKHTPKSNQDPLDRQTENNQSGYVVCTPPFIRVQGSGDKGACCLALSFEAWDTTLEKDCFMYADVDDAEALKQHLHSYILKRINRPKNRKVRRIETRLKKETPRVIGALNLYKINSIGGYYYV